ncbi:MAG: carbohydrate kinase family protein, partial [Candidatus Thiodiazotropha endolucinida]
LPEQVHILNVSFLVPDMRREFGGCAGNIAYNLKMLGGEGKPAGTVGDDFAPYAKWMDECGISREQVLEVPGNYTAQAYITTDKDDNQITAFHPGAMNQAHQIDVSTIDGCTLGMVSPDGRQGMIEHATQFAEKGVPFIFDPGQGMPMFDGDSLMTFTEQASWLAFNDYEAMLMQERTGKSLRQLAQMVEAIIVTRGGEGSEIITEDKIYSIPAAPVKAVVDPTGCGDAYRAGVLYGLMNEMDWETTGRIAALMGAIKVEQAGTQNHFVSPDEIGHRFEKAFDYKFK